MSARDQAKHMTIEELLLTPDEQAELRADLLDMARKRRKAEDAARDWPMP